MSFIFAKPFDVSVSDPVSDEGVLCVVVVVSILIGADEVVVSVSVIVSVAVPAGFLSSPPLIECETHMKKQIMKRIISINVVRLTILSLSFLL